MFCEIAIEIAFRSVIKSNSKSMWNELIEMRTDRISNFGIKANSHSTGPSLKCEKLIEFHPQIIKHLITRNNSNNLPTAFSIIGITIKMHHLLIAISNCYLLICCCGLLSSEQTCLDSRMLDNVLIVSSIYCSLIHWCLHRAPKTPSNSTNNYLRA